MEFFSEYLFLLSGLYLFVFWLVFFFIFRKNKEISKQMFYISLLFMIITPFFEQVCLIDWWQPNFVSKGFIHIEDLLFGFSIAGTSFGIFSLFGKKIELKKEFNRKQKLLIPLAIMFIFLCSFFVFGINSFWSSIIALLVFILLFITKIKKVFIYLIITGIILTILMIPGYFLGSYLSPNWIQEYWLLEGWPSNLFLTIPLAEYIYYFLTGFTVPLFVALLFNKRK